MCEAPILAPVLLDVVRPRLNRTMMISIEMDDALFADAMRLTGARGEWALVARALRELVFRSKRPSVQELFGIGDVAQDHDPKNRYPKRVTGRKRLMR